jgi:carbon monoxide dehydrogenase subunit G
VTDGSRSAPIRPSGAAGVAGPRCGRGPPVGGLSHGSLPAMADSSTQSILVQAPLAEVAAVICDFPRYPEWADAVKLAEVIEEYEDGYAALVRFVLDAGPLADDYQLEYAYSDDASRVEWHLAAPSKMQKVLNGSYDLVEDGGGNTTVTYTLEVELTVGMLGMFKRKAEKMIMDTALKELKRRVESLAKA